MLSALDLALVGVAALGAGLVNAFAGGGTLLSFPMLLAVGVPAVSANMTNTVALCPGYLGATLAQANDLRKQKARLRWAPVAGVVGGLVGGWLLLNTAEHLFRALVPFFILLASALLALQEPVRRWILRRVEGRGSERAVEMWAILPVAMAGIYGGYFGAGLSVILLAVLGLLLEDTLTRLNALKQAIALSTNVAAALFFVFSGKVVWSAALIMAVGALIGGSLGGRLAGRIKPATLRGIVVAIGVVVSVIYFVK